MAAQYEDIQKFSKEQVESSLKAIGTLSKGLQGIAAEVADYTKKSFEDSANVFEKLVAAKTFDKAMEIQAEYVRSSYEGMVAQGARIGELYADLAKEAIKPYEGALARAQSAASK